MRYSLKIMLGFAALFYSANVHSLDLTKINIAYQYDLGSYLKFEYRITEIHGDISVIYKIPNDTSNLWTFNILGQETYQSSAHDTLSIQALDTMHLTESWGIYKFMAPENKPNILLFSFSNLSYGVSRIFDVRISQFGGFPTFYPINENGIPIFNSYVTSNSMAFESEKNILHAFRYIENFDPADPPMGEMSALTPNLTIDSSIFFPKKIENLIDYNFYLVQSDTMDNHAISLYKGPRYYPELKQVEELIKPLRYITTSQENESLKNAADPRKAFESFWLNTYGTKFRAKGAIRYFYKQVEDANKLFTDYKPGWKTDRGILYIIYGAPDEVIRNERMEIWRYNSGEEFEFIRLPTLFTPSLYSLKRTTEYEKSWYNQVGEIRKGL